jgi:hypothetical protein
MAFWCNERFWVEDPRELFCNLSTVPDYSTSINIQLNALTRLVVLIAIFLLLVSKTLSLVFLFVSILFIILIYYRQRDMSSNMSSNMSNKIVECYDDKYRENCYNKNYKDVKDKCKPSKSARDSDLFAQKIDNNIKFNELRSQPEQCGQYTPLNTPNGPNGYPEPTRYMEQFPNEDYDQITNPTLNQRLVGGANPKTLIAPPVLHPITDLDHWRQDNTVNHSRINSAGYHDLRLSGYEVGQLPVDNTYKNYLCNPEKMVCGKRGNGYKRVESNVEELQTVRPRPEKSNGNGTNRNYPNMFVQNVQPNILSHSEVIEPINSNIGISMTRQLPPRGVSYDNEGNTFYERSPYIIEDNSPEPIGVAEHNVYDPRFTGYGSSNRTYVHELTGQPRHYYDDINSVRMPNYLVRSNIDFARYADKYGPLNEENSMGNKNTYGIRELANESFLQNSLAHRSDISERLMRKRNNELWEVRQYPKRRY